MALFVLWTARNGRKISDREAAEHRRRITSAVPVSPALVSSVRVGSYHLVTYATDTGLLPASAQFHASGVVRYTSACAIHGPLWTDESGKPRVLSARDVGTSNQIGGYCGSYSVVRVFRSHAVAFTDQEALHRLFFYEDDDLVAVSNRAALLAWLAGRRDADPVSMAWLTAIGYGFGDRTPYSFLRAVPQGACLRLEGARLSVDRVDHPTDFSDPERGLHTSRFKSDLAEGIEQAKAAILLAAGDRPTIDLPISGGKDSRVVLALSLAAGLRDRLRLFTDGFPDHPDVVVGKMVAEAAGLPHRVNTPTESGKPTIWSAAEIIAAVRKHAVLVDGSVGAYDLHIPGRTGQSIQLTGHVGEVLKAFARNDWDHRSTDEVGIVRLHAPFDPFNMLTEDARDLLVTDLRQQFAPFRSNPKVDPLDLPDLFNYRNRLPHWLGSICQLRAFDRQYIFPLGVPKLVSAAFRLTAEERRAEAIHYLILRELAPALIDVPFALQQWPALLRRLDPGLVIRDPVTVPPGSTTPVFGGWQLSFNRDPNVRKEVAALLLNARSRDVWTIVDRSALLKGLEHGLTLHRQISLLGFLTAFYFMNGDLPPVRISGEQDAGEDAELTAQGPRRGRRRQRPGSSASPHRRHGPTAGRRRAKAPSGAAS